MNEYDTVDFDIVQAVSDYIFLDSRRYDGNGEE